MKKKNFSCKKNFFFFNRNLFKQRKKKIKKMEEKKSFSFSLLSNKSQIKIEDEISEQIEEDKKIKLLSYNINFAFARDLKREGKKKK